MKSAFEIAMERLARESGPSKTLSDDQKNRIAAIESKYAAKIAEVSLIQETKLAQVNSMEEYQGVKAELASAIVSLEEKRDQEKDAVWNGD